MSSSFTGYYKRQYNSTVNGQQLLANLTGKEIQQLELAAGMASPPALAVIANTGVRLNSEQILQANVATQLINGASTLSTSLGSVWIGGDNLSQSQAFVQYFNLRSTNDVRVLRFTLSATGVTGVMLGNTSQTAFGGTSPGGSSTFVRVQVNGETAASAQILFTNPSIPGVEKIVLVSSSNLTAGSESVSFNILSGSA